MPELTVRLATSADAVGLANLPGQWDSEFARPEFAPDLAEWMDAHPFHHCVVAILDGSVVGMAWLAIVERVPRPGRLDRRSGDIQSVFVHPDARGLGVGKSMMSALDELASSLGLILQTVNSSTMGIALYESAGFASTPQLLRKRTADGD